MYILGISSFYHDSAAALIKNGQILGAVQEERFTRIKHDASFPHNSINYLLENAKILFKDIDYVVFYEKPFLKFERLLETYIATAPFGFKSFKASIPIWLREKLFLKDFIYKYFKKKYKEFNANQILFSEHHLSHAASAFYPSPFKKSVILTMDGVGEWSTTSAGIGNENMIEIKKEIRFPHSLGLLYSAFTLYTGFKINSGEYKLMGLAPYGKPKFIDIIKSELIHIKNDGSFRLNLKYFNYMTGLKMINKKFENLFGKRARKPDEKINLFYMDIAASIQSVTEEIVLKIANSLYEEFKIDNLCLSGGVALNCVANGKLLQSTNFKKVWIQPAAGDSGGALGASLAVWFDKFKNSRFSKNIMQGSYLGPSYSNKEIRTILDKNKSKYKKSTNEKLIQTAAEVLANDKYIGWFQGRMEFGPRALGNRSILANPCSNETQRDLNLKIKFRESFRPFAPAILIEETKNWFKLNCESPYMLLVSEINDKIKKNSESYNSVSGFQKLKSNISEIPAVTHVDFTSRIQTVHKETNPLFHKLLLKFFEITGCPILVNTSFNVRGEPIVCNPQDAYNCFMGTDLDFLFIGDFILSKKEQKNKIKLNYSNQFVAD